MIESLDPVKFIFVYDWSDNTEGPLCDRQLFVSPSVQATFLFEVRVVDAGDGGVLIV